MRDRENLGKSENTQDSVEKRTRKVFHDIHARQIQCTSQFERTLRLSSLESLGVDKDFFVGKTCLDAGCGSFAPGAQNMLALGASKVFAMDVDESIFELAPKYLHSYGERCDLRVGNVLLLEFPNSYFDFVLCNGVLHHTLAPLDGLRQLARVTKPGGILCVSTLGKGGLMEDIMDLFRRRYAEDKEFKGLIDTLTAGDFFSFFSWIRGVMRSRNDVLIDKVSDATFRAMFDEDLVLTIRDRLQAPLYHRISRGAFEDTLSAEGFTKIERLGRYQYYQNIRRFIAPLYFEANNPYAKLWFGDGYLQYKATKG